MPIKAHPIDIDDLLALQAAHTPTITAAMTSNTEHQQHKGTSLDDYGLLLSVSEAQQVLGLGRNSTYNLIRSGQLKSIRIGRLIKIPRAALEDYLNSY